MQCFESNSLSAQEMEDLRPPTTLKRRKSGEGKDLEGHNTVNHQRQGSHIQISVSEDMDNQTNSNTCSNGDVTTSPRQPEGGPSLLSQTTVHHQNNVSRPSLLGHTKSFHESSFIKKPQAQPNSEIQAKIAAAVADKVTELVIHGNPDQEIYVVPQQIQEICHISSLVKLDLELNQIRTLSDDIYRLRHLEELNVGKNDLKVLPRHISDLPALKRLILRLNRFKQFPCDLSSLSKLETLDLAYNRISAINMGLRSMIGGMHIVRSLKVLDLSFNYFTSFPAKLLDFENLESLNLRANSLGTIPAEIRRLTKLQHLNIADCNLATFPTSILSLAALQVLDISLNKTLGSSIPQTISSLGNLESLDVSDTGLPSLSLLSSLYNLLILNASSNQISGIPEDFVNSVKHLEHLNLSKNKFTQLPSLLSNLPNLRVLNMQSNQVAYVDENIGHLTCLQELYLNENSIVALPSSIQNLQKLKILEVNQNKLTSLPNISGLTSLEVVKADNNSLMHFPEGLENLSRNLRVISFCKNNIQEVPHSLYAVASLQELTLDSNKIPELTDSIAQLRSLVKLDLSKNDLTSIPEEIVKLSNLKHLYINQNSDITLSDEIKRWKEDNGVIIQIGVEKPQQILEKYFIGSARSVESKHVLKSLGITHILNVAKEVMPIHPPEDFRYMWIKAEDNKTENLRGYFEEVTRFIQEGREAGGVVVHCYAGRSRSAAFAIAYLMLQQKMKLKRAFAYVKRARPEILPNPAFIHQLVSLSDELFPKKVVSMSLGHCPSQSHSHSQSQNQEIIVTSANQREEESREITLDEAQIN